MEFQFAIFQPDKIAREKAHHDSPYHILVYQKLEVIFVEYIGIDISFFNQFGPWTLYQQ